MRSASEGGFTPERDAGPQGTLAFQRGRIAPHPPPGSWRQTPPSGDDTTRRRPRCVPCGPCVPGYWASELVALNGKGRGGVRLRGPTADVIRPYASIRRGVGG